MNVSYVERTPLGDLRKMMSENPLPVIPPSILQGAATEEPTKKALEVVNAVNSALKAGDAQRLEKCSFADQAFWKDQLALTYHLRTFSAAETVVTSLLDTIRLRKLVGGIELIGEAKFIPATPSLHFIDCVISFKTSSPAATCSGRLVLLPAKPEFERPDELIEWKIWILSTRLESLEDHPESEALLKNPSRHLAGCETFETDVFIIGGGNAAFTLAARLKALGVDSVMAERNARVGDNWTLRYDCLKFHLPTSVCELPYMNYDKELRTPHFLTKDDLAKQAQRYVTAMKLNMINSAEIKSTVYESSARQWRSRFRTPAGEQTAVAKHLVQATGVSSQKPDIPDLLDSHIYKGISIHSANFRNATELKKKGAGTAIIVGSANTGFDLLQDCCDAGLQTTMLVRSPTYIVPVEYICNPRSMGAYDDVDLEAADRMFLTLPACIDAQLGRGLLAEFAQQEPDRYADLAAAGFPVLDSRDPECVLAHNLLERAGGHYVDVGATRLIAEGKAGVKAGVEPVAFRSSGLVLSDGTTINADVIVWCTGFSDKDARTTVAEILGGRTTSAANAADMNGNFHGNKTLVGPQDIAARLEPTWNIDNEGEIRGLWKRHPQLDKFWITGGHVQYHRWHSKTLALQIKAALEGILPPAYRNTPTAKTES